MTEKVFKYTDDELSALRFRDQTLELLHKFYLSQGADSSFYFAESYSRQSPARWALTKAGKEIDLSPEMKAQWDDWKKRYAEVCERNPLFELHQIMHAISESHTASSWPDGYEWKIWKWVDAGDPAARPPFDDRHGIVTPAFFNRLRELRDLCGGWLYYSDRGVLFAPTSEWKITCAQHERRQLEVEKRARESLALIERTRSKTLEVISLAKADSSFWFAFRQWETERERKRPPSLPSNPGGISGPFRIGQHGVIAEGAIKHPNLDPILSEFLARTYRDETAINVMMMVLLLRGEVRHELGLDHVLVWPGGPELGVG